MDHSTKVHSPPLAGLHSLPIMLHGTIVTGKTMADEDVVQASIQTHRRVGTCDTRITSLMRHYCDISRIEFPVSSEKFSVFG